MKKKLPLSKVYQLLGFGPVVFITSALKGKANIMPISWLMPVDFDPPKIAVIIGDQSYTFKIISRTREFVINIPTADLIKKVMACGDCSGRNTNKFKKFKLTPLPSKIVKAPGIHECPVNIECKVIDSSLAGKYNIFIAQAKACRVENGLFKRCYRVDKNKFKPLFYLGQGSFTVPDKIRRG